MPQEQSTVERSKSYAGMRLGVETSTEHMTGSLTLSEASPQQLDAIGIERYNLDNKTKWNGKKNMNNHDHLNKKNDISAANYLEHKNQN